MHRFLFLVLTFFMYAHHFAQVRFNDRGEIETTEIVIEKNKKITFPERTKITERANSPTRTSLPEPKTFDYSDVSTPIPPTEPRIKLSTIKSEQKQLGNRNYLKLGAANYLTSYLEGQVSTPLKPKYNAGIHAKHLAAMRGPVKYSGSSENKIEGYGNYYHKKFTANALAGYERLAGYYYGYHRSFEPNSDVRDSTYQAYHLFKIQSSVQSVDTTQNFNYRVQAAYFNFSDRNKLTENEANLFLNTRYQIDTKNSITAKSELAITRFADSLARNLFYIQPEYQREVTPKLLISAGFNVAAENDTANNTPRVHVYPVVEAKYQLLPQLTALAGINGGVQKNVWRTSAQNNFFLGNQFALIHTNQLYHAFAGIQGNVTRNIVIRSMPSFAGYRNMPFFINSLQDSTLFTLLYDRGTTTLFKWENSVDFEPNQLIKTGISASYFYYVTDKIDKPWHLPTLQAQAYLQLKLNEQFTASADVLYLGGITALSTYSQKAVNLDDIIDINLRGVYKISNRFSVYLYLFNILAQNYERYYLYPVRGITVLGGLQISF